MHEQIIRDIRRAYKSLAEPEYFFVRSAIESRPYQSIADDLARRFAIVEDTDANYDVSFGYLLDDRWVVRLSMVGPYAAILRLVPRSSAVHVLSEEAPDLSPEEACIIRSLRGGGIQVLDQTVLEHPVRMRSIGSGETELNVYRVLFTDTDVLPWRQTDNNAQEG